MIKNIIFPSEQPTNGVWRSAYIQARVVWALFLREIITRYGRHNIGFMWLFVEPMMFTCGVTVMYSILHAGFRVPIATFIVTGYSVILQWRNGVNRCALAIEPNRALLFHRNVRVIDFFLSRLILEISGATISFFVIASILVFFGVMEPPRNILLLIFGWAMLSWFVIGLGLLVGSLSEYSEAIDRIWHTLTYLMLPFSGLFFMVDWLPTYIHKWAVWIPLINATEMVRSGYFGETVRAHYDVSHFAIINTVLTFLGLFLVRDVGRRVEGA